jgi:hypothetical protein
LYYGCLVLDGEISRQDCLAGKYVAYRAWGDFVKRHHRVLIVQQGFKSCLVLLHSLEVQISTVMLEVPGVKMEQL